MTQQDVDDWTPLRTESLLLRRPRPDDLDPAVQIHTDPSTNRHHPEPWTVTEESSARRFQELGEHWERHGFGVWVVEQLEQPGVIVGFTGLSHRTVHQRSALNLYYRYAPDVWGKGYATEAASTAVRHAAIHLSDLPVLAYTTPDNLGSQRTALRVGLDRMSELDIEHEHYTDIFFAHNWPAGAKSRESSGS
ncbi:GNAT family N-acetyltransferase [Saxibacter everestensis]|uniref:GNAT family N-acetyltransferase n=1 Tax=Saxibacter everestensis TaxID=2909229 RepID=A0ABY8QV71_9MICO|nr:GNAT family N-acetyltransferase [Brevibacteriaceae bacterium ZFBP1038]